MGEYFWKSFKVCLTFHILWTNLAFWSLLSISNKEIKFLQSFKIFLTFLEYSFVFVDKIRQFWAFHQCSVTPILETNIWKVSMFASYFQKIAFAFISQIWHFWVLYQYSIIHKIIFRLLSELKTNLSTTPIWVKTFRKVLSFVLLSQRNRFVFVDLVWYFRVFYQCSITKNVPFRFLTDFKTGF